MWNGLVEPEPGMRPARSDSRIIRIGPFTKKEVTTNCLDTPIQLMRSEA